MRRAPIVVTATAVGLFGVLEFHTSIPIPEQQALQAQSANFQGVSGASFTTAGFEQSLQGALHQLGR